MFTSIRKLRFPLALVCFSHSCIADVSITTSIVSDYLFNGLSQTEGRPTLQASIDYENNNGWYAGTFASGVDYGEGTHYEIDFYGGYAGDVSETISFDIGAAAYTYYGSSVASEVNYNEVYGSLDYNASRLQVWYTNDYFGSSARHVIVAVSHSIEVSENLSLLLLIDRSVSLDSEQFEWDTNDNDYVHYKVEAAFEWLSLFWTLGLEKSDVDYDDGLKVLLTSSFTFEVD